MEFLRQAPKPLLILLSFGLILRLLLAYFILPGSGFPNDVHWFSQWGLTLEKVGPSHFYAASPDTDYPPGYLYILWFVGSISQALASATGTDVQSISMSLVKLPPMLLDIGDALLLYHVAQRLSVDPKTSASAGVTAAAIYLFNPVSWYDSAIWGQADSAGVFVALLGMIALLRWPPEIAAALSVVCALVKPQFGVVMMPLVGVVLFRRHLLPSHDANLLGTQSHWCSGNGPMRLLTSAAIALVVFYALVIPFDLNLTKFLDRMESTANNYPFLSVNAFNPWALVTSGADHSLMLAGIDHWARDDVALVGELTGVSIGTALLIAGFILGTLRLSWRIDNYSIMLVGAYLCLCFFILPTRVHERYVFEAFAFLSVLAAFDRRWFWATLLLSIGSLMNFQAVLSVDGTANLVRLPLGSFLRSSQGIFTGIALNCAVFLFAFWRLRPKVHGVYDLSQQSNVTAGVGGL